MPLIDVNYITELRRLTERLRSPGFSWQHEDYVFLKEVLPIIIIELEEN